MLNKILLALSFITISYFVFSQNAISEPNFSYKIYDQNNYTQLKKDVSEINKDSQILFIVDFSNSMNDPIQGRTKLEIARTTLAEILPKIPANIK